MPAEFIKKRVSSSELPQTWQREVNARPKEMFIITIQREEEHTPQECSDNTVEVGGKIYELDMSPDLPMAEINASLGGFDFLKNEPDIY
ncbi:MAG: hypothetical protein U9N77_15480 [Thermodesulfobacteriota bacterium]|nr:hypothetical protein [Thermodesulfobacteriota bacterium]